MLPNAQLKFGDIHDILQEEFDVDLTEPFPQEWTEILEQLHRPETGQRQARASAEESAQAKTQARGSSAAILTLPGILIEPI